MVKRYRGAKPLELIEKLFKKHKNANLLAKPGPLDLIIVLDHLKSDFNIGKIFRSAQAFGCREIHLIGIEVFDPTPAKGSIKHVPAKFFKTTKESLQSLQEQGYTLFAFDPKATEKLNTTQFPQKSAFIFGHEEKGLSITSEQYPDLRFVQIEQVGSMQSLNVSIAASIALYRYSTTIQKND